MHEYKILGMTGLLLAALGCAIFLLLMIDSERLNFLNPPMATIVSLVFALAALILGICSIKTTPGKISAIIGFVLIAVIVILFPANTVVHETHRCHHQNVPITTKRANHQFAMVCNYPTLERFGNSVHLVQRIMEI